MKRFGALDMSFVLRIRYYCCSSFYSFSSSSRLVSPSSHHSLLPMLLNGISTMVLVFHPISSYLHAYKPRCSQKSYLEISSERMQGVVDHVAAKRRAGTEHGGVAELCGHRFEPLTVLLRFGREID